MSAIRSKDTKPEVYLRKLLFAQGVRYRIATKNIPGHPDIFLRKYNTAIFVNGCFWHRCPHCNPSVPKRNTEFWKAKFRRNVERDARAMSFTVQVFLVCFAAILALIAVANVFNTIVSGMMLRTREFAALRSAGMEVHAFLFLFVEKEPPYLTVATNISEGAQELALDEIRNCVDTFADCMASGIWPGYTESPVIELDLPAWAYKRNQ